MKTVTIYSTPACHYCGEAKKFFTAMGVKYTEYDVKENLERRKEMVDRSNQMKVPVICVGDEVFVGFDRAQLALALQ